MLSLVLGGLDTAGRFFLKNPIWIALALLCSAFVLVVVSKNSEISGLNKQIFDPRTGYAVRLSDSERARTTADANVATLNLALKEQSDSITALKQQGDASSAKFDSLLAGQAVANATIAQKVAAIDKAKPGADKCKAAFDLVRGSVQ